MSIDLATFNPANVSEFTKALTSEISDLGKDWWNKNSSIVRGYIRSLAHAAQQTGKALAAGVIDAAYAKELLERQKDAFGTAIKFGEFMTAALAQSVVDKAFGLIAAAIKNKTGISISL
ncbi:MAG: hypothetical protein AAGP08_01540 [Pseudomonadota bacterium]